MSNCPETVQIMESETEKCAHPDCINTKEIPTDFCTFHLELFARKKINIAKRKPLQCLSTCSTQSVITRTPKPCLVKNIVNINLYEDLMNQQIA